jgi:hypothetical protein
VRKLWFPFPLFFAHLFPPLDFCLNSSFDLRDGRSNFFLSVSLTPFVSVLDFLEDEVKKSRFPCLFCLFSP